MKDLVVRSWEAGGSTSMYICFSALRGYSTSSGMLSLS